MRCCFDEATYGGCGHFDAFAEEAWVGRVLAAVGYACHGFAELFGFADDLVEAVVVAVGSEGCCLVVVGSKELRWFADDHKFTY